MTNKKKIEPTEWKLKYQEYIKSPEWYSLKLDLIKIRGCKCERCKKPKHATKLHVHHLTYERLFKEKAEDLMLLCAICHMKEHGLIKDKKPRIKKVKKSKKTKAAIKRYEEKLKRIEKGYKSGVYKTFDSYMRAKTKAAQGI